MQQHPQTDEHVAHCVDCQARWALAGLDVDLDHVWHGVAAHAWAAPVSHIEGIAGGLLRSPGLARALVTTPSLWWSWVLASALVLAIGAWMTHQAPDGPPWVALLAPALVGAAIAYAYGPGVDPAWELSQTMVIGDRQVLLVRALAVFGLNAVLGLLASVISADAASITWGWLAPMLMVSAFALAGSTVARSANVGVLVALGGWAITVLSAEAIEDIGNPRIPFDTALDAAVSGGTLVPVYLGAAAVGVAVAVWATRGRTSIGGRTAWQ